MYLHKSLAGQASCAGLQDILEPGRGGFDSEESEYTCGCTPYREISPIEAPINLDLVHSQLTTLAQAYLETPARVRRPGPRFHSIYTSYTQSPPNKPTDKLPE